MVMVKFNMVFFFVFFFIHWLIDRQTSTEWPAGGGVSSSQRTVYEAICGKTGGSHSPLAHAPTLLVTLLPRAPSRQAEVSLRCQRL